MHVKCNFCGAEKNIEISDEHVAQWKGGELLQRVVPNMSSDDREFLISKTCPTCWDGLFGEGDDALGACLFEKEYDDLPPSVGPFSLDNV